MRPMFPVRSVIKLFQRFAPALILFVTAAACRAQIIIGGGGPTISFPAGPYTTDQYKPVGIGLATSDSWGEPVSYISITASVGTLELQGSTLTYFPDTNRFFQGATISVEGVSSYAYVSGNIAILPAQPVISFTASSTIVFPGTEAQVVIVSNGQPALIAFDGSGTVSTNSLPVSETWYDGTNCIQTNGQSFSLWESSGSHTIRMTATDGISTNTGSETIEILTPAGAVSNLVNYVAQSGVSKKTSSKLKRILSKAEQWAKHEKERQAYIELSDLQTILQSTNNPVSLEMSTNMVTAAQEIMNNLSTAKR